MAKKPVIYDGDMGGDDLWAIAILLAHRDRFNIKGISTVFGNVSQPQAAKNAANFLHWLGIEDIEVAEGANMPCDGMRPFGDDAYGDNGVGGVILPESPTAPNKVDIAAWLRTRLYEQPEKTRIFATGPATNLAHLVTEHPESIEKIEEIVFMGGAIDTIGKDGAPAFDKGERRIGNITLHSEFNAYQDPKALNILIQSGAPVTVMAADATQHMVLTPERQDQVKQLHETYGPAFHSMLMAVEHLDRAKFGVDGPFIHDPNVIAYLLAPELYGGQRGVHATFHEADPHSPAGAYRGKAALSGNFGNAVWLNEMKDTKKVWALMKESLAATIAQASYNPALLAK
jgi:inosine-uridine nucleoside N-ribohydrolase